MESDCGEVKEAVDIGTSLLVEWLRLYASYAGGMGPTPGPGTKILHALGHSQKKSMDLKKFFCTNVFCGYHHA